MRSISHRESGILFQLSIVCFHRLDLRRRRATAAPRGKLRKRGRFRLGLDIHAAIIIVPNEAAHTERPGLRACRGAEADSLHHAPDMDINMLAFVEIHGFVTGGFPSISIFCAAW